MKKITILSVFSFLVLFSCKIDKEKFKENLESVGTDKNDATEIVAYNNVLIKLSDARHSYFKSMDGNLNKIANGLEDYNDRFAFIGLTPLIYTPSIGYNEPKPEEPGTAFKKDDKAFFEKNVKELNESFKTIQTKYTGLNDYIKAEDYKDDQGKAGKEMIDEIDDLIVKYYATNKSITERIMVLSEQAEREVLKTHPFKDHIFAMKDASNKVAEFVTLAYEAPDNYSSNEAKFKELYTEIEMLNAEREKLKTPKNDAYPGKETYFTSYNKSANDFLITARKIMRNATGQNAFTNYDLEDLARAEENLRRSYNNFVD